MTVFIQPLALSLLMAGFGSLRFHRCHAFSGPTSFASNDRTGWPHLEMATGSATVAIAVEDEEEDEMEGVAVDGGRTWKDATASASTSATKRVGINSRGAKLNEVRLMNDIEASVDPSAILTLSIIACYRRVTYPRFTPPFLRSTSLWSPRTRAYRGVIK
jgi:hypothetical protein